MANFGNSWLEEFERIAVEKGWNISKEARFQGPLAEKIQNGINEVASKFVGFDPALAAIKVAVDKDFGPKSMAALNAIRQTILKPEFTSLYPDHTFDEIAVKLSSPEGDAKLWDEGLISLLSVFLDVGTPAQRYVEAYKAKTEGVTDHIVGQNPVVKPVAKPEEPFVKDTMPKLKEVSIPGQPEEHFPNLADDTKVSAAVISSLVSLANDLDAMGAEDAALAVDRRLVLYKEAVDKLYDVHGETGEKLIEMAHPGGGPVIVSTKDEGGKVETIVEEHKKMVEKSTKNPTGKIAKVIQKLIVRANALEDAGEIEAACAVDNAIEQLREVSLPFVDRSTALEAAGSEDKVASIKVADDEVVRKQLYSKIYVFMTHVTELQKYVDTFGAEASKMKILLKNFLYLYGELVKDEKKISLQEIASRVKQLASIISSSNINVEDALGSSDSSKFWAVEKEARQLVAFVDSIKFENTSKPNKSSTETQSQSKEDISKTKPNLHKYRYWLKKLEDLIAYNAEARKFLIAGNASGKENLKLLYKWVLNESKADYNEYDAVTQHDELWSKVLSPLKQFLPTAGKTSVSSAVSLSKKLKKISAPPPFVVNPKGGIVTHSPATNRPVGAKGVGPKKLTDPNIQALQEAMMSVGIKIAGKNPNDGIWGANTSAAYNDFIQKIQSLYPNVKFPTSSATQAPSVATIQRALQASRIMSHALRVTEDVEIAPGKNIPGSALRNSKAFVSALVVANVISEGPNQNAEAAKIIKDFVARYNSDSDFKDQLILNYGDTYVKNVASAMPRLYKSLEAPATADTAEKASWRTDGDLLDPFTKDTTDKSKTPDGKTPAGKNLNFGNNGDGIVFDSNDVQSVINAIERLRPENLENTDIARYHYGNDPNNPSLKQLDNLNYRVGELIRALEKNQEEILRASNGGIEMYNRLNRKVNHFAVQLRSLYGTARAQWRA
jgi:hypothetical protein